MRFSLVKRLLNSILQYSSACRYKFNLSQWNVSASRTSFLFFFFFFHHMWAQHCTRYCFSGFFPSFFLRRHFPISILFKCWKNIETHFEQNKMTLNQRSRKLMIVCCLNIENPSKCLGSQHSRGTCTLTKKRRRIDYAIKKEKRITIALKWQPEKRMALSICVYVCRGTKDVCVQIEI